MDLPKFKIKRNVICYDSYKNSRGFMVRTNHYYKLNSVPPSIIKVLAIYEDKEDNNIYMFGICRFTNPELMDFRDPCRYCPIIPRGICYNTLYRCFSVHIVKEQLPFLKGLLLIGV